MEPAPKLRRWCLGAEAAAKTMESGGDRRTAAQLSARIAELEAALAQSIDRLREVDHRIKNDLQLIASIFVLQARRLPDGPARETIRSALERLSAVAATHRRLDILGDPKHLDAAGLVAELVDEMTAAASRDDVQLHLDLTPTSTPARQAVPLALIVNELVRNALRHAFPGRAGVLTVSLHPTDGEVRLAVEDDGVGRPPDAPQGFGFALVDLLTQQLRGEFALGGGPAGVQAVLRFPKAT